MSCFVAPLMAAVVTTAINHNIKKAEANKSVESEGVSFSKKVSWLNTMLWGGSALLAFEHAWHGELSLSQISINEIVSVGIPMTLLVTLVWAIIAVSVTVFEKRYSTKTLSSEIDA